MCSVVGTADKLKLYSPYSTAEGRRRRRKRRCYSRDHITRAGVGVYTRVILV